MKLELKHLAPYLPYGLKAEILDYKSDYIGKRYDEIVGFHQWDKNCLYWSALTIGGSKPNIERIKPILRPLSELTREIEHNGEKFVPSIELNKILNIDKKYNRHFNTKSVEEGVIVVDFGDHAGGYSVSEILSVVQKLLEWHFDIYSLIEAGLAVDINTLKTQEL